MIKEKLKQEFEELLIRENMFGQFVSSLGTHSNISFNDYLNSEDPYDGVCGMYGPDYKFVLLYNIGRLKLQELDAINLDVLCEMEDKCKNGLD